MGEKNGGGYRHRAKGDKGVVFYLPAEEHAALLKALALRGGRLQRRVTLQEWMASLAREATQQELNGQQPPPEPPVGRAGKRKK